MEPLRLHPGGLGLAHVDDRGALRPALDQLGDVDLGDLHVVADYWASERAHQSLGRSSGVSASARNEGSSPSTSTAIRRPIATACPTARSPASRAAVGGGPRARPPPAR